ncbi:MAG: ADP-ribosylglycohydrolase family protein, partial [Tissierellales bacterium]|nr:ADP-ribosylglycohydrolase family protein [Tissierellales bacterium]
GVYLTIAEYISKEYDLKEAVEKGIKKSFQFYENKEEFKEELKHYKRIKDKNFNKLPEVEIKSTGYVVYTLEAVIWCLLNSANHKECILKAVNLGEDTDTVGAVAGGLAGLYYGYEGIPKEWVERIKRREFIEELCRNF